jgi:hypothetical protein
MLAEYANPALTIGIIAIASNTRTAPEHADPDGESKSFIALLIG